MTPPRAALLGLGLAASVVLAGCSGAGPEGEPEDGAAALTVTYTPAPDAEPVSVEVTVAGTDCFVDVSGTHFGEDVDPAARAEHLEAVADDVDAPLGFYAGAVSGLAGEEPVLSVVLPDGGVFVARQPLEMADGGFEVTDLPGTVGDSARTDTSSVDDAATVSGHFTCGTTETSGG